MNNCDKIISCKEIYYLIEKISSDTFIKDQIPQKVFFYLRINYLHLLDEAKKIEQIKGLFLKDQYDEIGKYELNISIYTLPFKEVENLYLTYNTFLGLSFMIQDIKELKEFIAMDMSKQIIYDRAVILDKLFIQDNLQLELPIKVNYILHKNIETLRSLALEIDKKRLAIGEKYADNSKQNEEGSISIKKEFIDLANHDLQSLMSENVNVPIVKLKISDFQDVKITSELMQAIFFMIEED